MLNDKGKQLCDVTAAAAAARNNHCAQNRWSKQISTTHHNHVHTQTQTMRFVCASQFNTVEIGVV